MVNHFSNVKIEFDIEKVRSSFDIMSLFYYKQLYKQFFIVKRFVKIFEEIDDIQYL